MPRARNPNRNKALEIYREHNGDITNRKIAELLDEDEKVVAVWKQRDKWNDVQQSRTKVVQQTKKGGAPKGNQNAKGHGAPKGNKNAVGNSGGPGGPPRNDKAVTHGFFRMFLPDDEEMQEIVDRVSDRTPLDMLWDMIEIKYMAIIRGLKIMYVRDQEDITQVLKKEKVAKEKVGRGEDARMEETFVEREWELQMPWDKYATYLNAQSRAMSELRSLIKDFLNQSGEDDERRLKFQQMQLNMDKTKAEIEKLKGADDDKPIEILIKRKGEGA